MITRRHLVIPLTHLHTLHLPLHHFIPIPTNIGKNFALVNLVLCECQRSSVSHLVHSEVVEVCYICHYSQQLCYIYIYTGLNWINYWPTSSTTNPLTASTGSVTRLVFRTLYASINGNSLFLFLIPHAQKSRYFDSVHQCLSALCN